MEIMKKRMAQRGEGGFTLIELLVVIAILAILAGVVVFAVGNSTTNAKLTACQTEAASITTANEAAKTSNLVNATREEPEAYMSSALKYFTVAKSGAAAPYTYTYSKTADGTAAGAGCVIPGTFTY